jgi:translation initiation factor IF-3
VKATVFFRGREMAHPEIGRRILERLIGELSEVALAESGPRQEGNQMHAILTGKSDKSGRRPAAAPAADAVRRPAPSTTAAAPAPVGAAPLAGAVATPPAPEES